MTQNYHTPIAYGAPAQSGIINTPLGELDAAIAAVNAAITAVNARFAGVKYSTLDSIILSSGSEEVLTFSNLIHDPDNLFNGQAFQAPADGGYLVLTLVPLPASAAWNVAEYVKQHLVVNGAQPDGNYMALHYMQAAANTPLGIAGMGVAILEEFDELEVMIVQNSGSSITISGDPNNSWIAISRIF